jgi:hypothetical protein
VGGSVVYAFAVWSHLISFRGLARIIRGFWGYLHHAILGQIQSLVKMRSPMTVCRYFTV